MKEDAGLSLRDALLWKKCEMVSASEFVISLQIWDEIGKKEAIERLGDLVISGLPIYDRNSGDVDTLEVPLHLALIAIINQTREYPFQEINGEPIPEFSNFRISRKEAFKLFAKMCVKEPYPWPYPTHWLSPDLEETEEIPTSETIPHGNKARFAIVREDILSACLAVLAKYPEECRNKDGKVTATALRECLDKNAGKFWPESGSPPQEVGTVEKLICRALNRIK